MSIKKNRTSGNTKNSELLELINESYIGVIEEIDDPKKIGRCKIRVFGVYGDKEDSLGSIPLADLPFAYPVHDTFFGSESGSGKFSTPKIGVKVRVIFEDDIYHPRYIGIEELDEELKGLIEADYENFHSLLYDSDKQLKVYYAVNTGLLIELDGSFINIEPGGAIIVAHKESQSVLEMRGGVTTLTTQDAVDITTPNTITHNSNQIHVNGAQTDLGGNPIYSAVNGEILFKLLNAIAVICDNKYPTTPGVTTNLVKQMESLCLSKTVSTTP